MLTLLTVVVFIVLILLLVGFHELGHFLVALLCRVPVRRFSIGFGKPVLRWRGARGIEYVLGWLPLGGYVQLADARDGLAYNATVKRSVWQLLLVIIAGPLANFLLALVAFYFACMLGKTLVKPVVGAVVPHSIAAKAGIRSGQEIVRVGSYPVLGWQQVKLRLVSYLGESGVLLLTIRDQQGLSQHRLLLSHWQLDQYNPRLLKSLGLTPQLPAKGQTWPASALVKPHYTAWRAVAAAWQQWWLMMSFNAVVIWKLITGKLSLKLLAGPLTLFKTAQLAVREGLVIFLEVLGALSIAIGFVNLLPIPGLDGAQVVYLLIEKLRGRSLSIGMEALLFKLGMIIVVVLILQATINDLVRWVGVS